MKREAHPFAYCCASLLVDACDCAIKDHDIAYLEVAGAEDESDTAEQVNAAADCHLVMHAKADEDGHYW